MADVKGVDEVLHDCNGITGHRTSRRTRVMKRRCGGSLESEIPFHLLCDRNDQKARRRPST
jgi:hypothetical protein